MVGLLAKLFIRNSGDSADPKVRLAYGTLCGCTGIALNLVLFAVKYFAGTITGAISVLADAFNNLSDAGSSIVTLLGFRLAEKRPDADHPYGHGRIEYISGLVVAALILVVGFELGRDSVMKIIHPEPIETGWLAAGILIASIAVKLYMWFYNRRIGKKIRSAAMTATATDSLSDAAATAVVLLGMGVSAFTGANIDGYIGLLVALFIIYAGYTAARDTLSPLLGSPPDPEFVHEIEKRVMAHPEILGIHDLIVHDYGPGRRMITLHAEADGKSDAFHLHEVIDCIEVEINEAFGCIATIHLDPIETDNEAVAALRRRVLALIRCLDERINIHDFRVVPGDTHTNVIFDAVIPYGFRMKDDEAAKTIRNLVSAHDPRLHAVVTIDHDYAGIEGIERNEREP